MRSAKTSLIEVESVPGVAKYRQLRNSLAAAISAGRWKAGERLPPEEAFAQATGLSLGTVQHAMRLLVDDRLVVRRQGSGTFVAVPETPMHAPLLHCRFLDDATGETLPIFSRFLRRRTIRARGRWSAFLRSREVVCVERLFSIHNEFAVYTHLYFERDRFPRLAGTLSAKTAGGINVKDVIAHDFGLTLTRFSETLSVRGFPDYVCHAAHLARGTSGAVIEIVAYDAEDVAVYFQDLLVPPNDRRLVV